MRCPICHEEVSSTEQAQQWGPEWAHSNCVTAFNVGKADAGMQPNGSPEFRIQAIKTRRLEIAATLANWKRDYLVQGIERSRGERATLEAEDANLALEIRQISDAAHLAKIERRKREDGRLLNQLLAVLGEQGLQDVVAEAQRRAQDAQD